MVTPSVLRDLSAVRKLNHDFLHHCPVAVFICGKKGNVDYANPAFLALHEMKNPLAARRIKVFAHPHFVKSGVSRAVKRAFRGQPDVKEYVPYEYAAGSKKFLRIHTVPIRDHANKIQEVLVMAEDVTDTVRLQQYLEEYSDQLEDEVTKRTHQLQETNVKLKDEIKLKDELFNITSHELKTPLISIMGYLELLEGDQLGELNKGQKDALTIVGRNTHRLHALIRDILDLSKLQAKRLDFTSKPLSVKELLNEARNQFLPVAQEKDVNISVACKPSIPKIHLDRKRTLQAITNLVDNALAFTSKGAVTLRAHRKGNSVIIDVADTGRGIPKKYHTKIFDKFFQIESSITRVHDGVGLGLAITKSLVEQQGGSVFLHTSKTGKGAVFRIVFPIRKSKT